MAKLDSIEVHHYIHLADAECSARLGRIENLLRAVLAREENIMATIDEVLSDVQDESTVEDSLITLVTGIKSQLDAALASQGIPPDVQAKIDAVFSGIEANKAKVAAAITANTPAAPTA